MDYHVAICGLSEIRAHHLQIVVSSVPAAKNSYHFGMTAALPSVDLVLVNLLDEGALSQLAQIRSEFPAAVAAYISKDGTVGDTRYCIAARSLMLGVRELLELAVSENFSEVDRASATRVEKSGPGQMPISAVKQRLQKLVQSALQRRERTESLPAADTFSTRLKALVVDDSAAVRNSVCAALSTLGVDSVQASDAALALVLLQNMKFDLALLDVVMDGMSGYELCRKIKHDRQLRQMPVIILTSKSSPFDRARGVFAGCDRYLTKPMNENSLAIALNKTLKRGARKDRRQSGSSKPTFLPIPRYPEGRRPG